MYVGIRSYIIYMNMCVLYRYSCNEGMSWSDFSFSSSASTVVWGMNSEPGESTSRVLLVIL